MGFAVICAYVVGFGSAALLLWWALSAYRRQQQVSSDYRSMFLEDIDAEAYEPGPPYILGCLSRGNSCRRSLDPSFRRRFSWA